MVFLHFPVLMQIFCEVWTPGPGPLALADPGRMPPPTDLFGKHTNPSAGPKIVPGYTFSNMNPRDAKLSVSGPLWNPGRTNHWGVASCRGPPAPKGQGLGYFAKICLSTRKCLKNHCKNQNNKKKQKKQKKIRDMDGRRKRCQVDLFDFFCFFLFFWFFQWFFFSISFS